MADEILVLEGDRDERYRMLMLFPIASPAQAGGSNVVPTPSSDLDSTAADLLTAGEISALDGGTLAYRMTSMHKEPGLTNPQLVARVQAIYAAQLADFEAEYAVRYAHIGTRVDAS